MKHITIGVRLWFVLLTASLAIVLATVVIAIVAKHYPPAVPATAAPSTIDDECEEESECVDTIVRTTAIYTSCPDYRQRLEHIPCAAAVCILCRCRESSTQE